MSFEPVITLKNLGKCYQIYDKPRDRLLQMLVRSKKQYYREFWALKHVDFQIMPGEVVGVIGRNGSGKSTLLQLVCGTLSPTFGEVSINGRVAALLELGAGFNPEFSGRENVFLSAAITGMSWQETEMKFDEIVEFSGIQEFIDQPVKTYSSGMYVRLAFSIAIHVNPDILVIDEALSVGDGVFARKSFERIMALKESGTTILFCSHSLYQVEAICTRVLWLERGALKLSGEAAVVTSAYGQFLNSFIGAPEQGDVGFEDYEHFPEGEVPTQQSVEFVARITKVELSVNNNPPVPIAELMSGADDISVAVEFTCSSTIPSPNIGIVFCDKSEQPVTSVGSHIDNIKAFYTPDGRGFFHVSFLKFPLLKGEYFLYVYLLCERGIHVYDLAGAAAKIIVSQSHLEQGVVSIPRTWQNPTDKDFLYTEKQQSKP